MLRIAPTNRSGSRNQNIKKDFSHDQLAAIGAVVAAWNEVEFMLDCGLYSGEKLPAECLLDDLPKRALDQRVKDAKKAVRHWALPTDFINTLETSIAAFVMVKDIRNAVAHSRIYDSTTAIGNRITRKGTVEEVLLSTKALDWLYENLMILKVELRAMIAIFDLVRNTEIAEQQGLVSTGQIDPIPEATAWLGEIKKCQANRDALGSAPSF